MVHSSKTAKSPLRLALVFCGVILLPTISPAADTPLRKFVDTYCVSCHDSATTKGGLNLEKLSVDFKEPAAFASWVKVHDRIQAGDMPPKARKTRPNKAEADAVLKDLAMGLSAADRSRRAGDGRAIFRRLNRTEYENTLRDLFSLPALGLKDQLPEDGSAFGFDKSAAALDLSYVQIAKYMEAAEAVLDAAIAPHAARPMRYKEHFSFARDNINTELSGNAVFLKDFKYDDSLFPLPRELMSKEDKKSLEQKLKQAGKVPYTGTVGVFRSEGGLYKPVLRFHPAYPGKYKIRLSVWSFLWDKGEVKPNPRTEATMLMVGGKTLGYFDAPSLKPTVGEIEVWLNPKRGDPISSAIHFDTVSLPLVEMAQRKGLAAEYVGRGIAIDWFEVEGPLFEQWPPPSHRRLFDDVPLVALPPVPKGKAEPKVKGAPKGKGKANDPAHDVHVPQRPPEGAFQPQFRGLSRTRIEFSTVASKEPQKDARRLLADFLPRAFRRPVSPDDIQRYVDYFKVRLDQGDWFEVAMRKTYRAALCSPDFLFLKEPRGTLDDWALASRLSYFLWNSMPDDTLLDLAKNGKLRDKTILHDQVERMLKDPKAERFVVDFIDQWLDIAEIDATTPDRKLYPEYKRILRDAMLGEPRAFFRELLEKDLSATNVVHSDFAMLNQRLAEHYRIPGVVGTAIRPVALPADCGRGGFLTQAAVLKVTANGTVTSPVKRGAWVMRKIVGKPPEPPPPNVPAIEPDVRGTTTVREMLAKHRSNASCAACHNKIDPPGFALESFDVIGGRQTRYRSLNEEGDRVNPSETYSGNQVAYKWGPKVDSSGALADGRSFQNLDEFKKLLLADPRAIARNLVEQLVTYATGAPVEFADRPAVDRVLDNAEGPRDGGTEGPRDRETERRRDNRQYGVRTLIHEIVQSPLFLSK